LRHAECEGTQTVRRLAERFLEIHVAKKKPRTVQTYRSHHGDWRQEGNNDIGKNIRTSRDQRTMKLTLQQLEAHLWGAANILRGKTAGQDYKNYILSLMFFKRLCDQWEGEADDAIAELERQQKRGFSEQQKAVFRRRASTGSRSRMVPAGAT
jgi:type I restriction enzyme M protein